MVGIVVLGEFGGGVFHTTQDIIFFSTFMEFMKDCTDENCGG